MNRINRTTYVIWNTVKLQSFGGAAAGLVKSGEKATSCLDLGHHLAETVAAIITTGGKYARRKH